MEEEESQLSVVDPLSYHATLLKSGLHTDGRPLNQANQFSLQVGVVGSANGSCMLKQGSNTVMTVINAELAEPHYTKQDRGIISLTLEASAAAGVSSLQQDWINLSENNLYRLLIDDSLVCTQSLSLKKGQLCWKLSCSIVLLEASASILDSCLTCLEVALRHTKLPEVKLDDDVLDDQGQSVGRKLKPVIDLTDKKVLIMAKNLPVATTFLITDFLQRMEGDPEPKIITEPSEQEINELKGGLCTVLTVGDPVQLMGFHSIPYKQIVPFSPSLIEACLKLAMRRHKNVKQVIKQTFES